MELEDLLNVFDRAAANLEQLDKVWARASAFIPRQPAFGSPDEYDDLARTWLDLLPGLPPIHSWTITEPLPDIDTMGHALLDYAEIGELPTAVWEVGERPGKDLAEYRHQLARARRQAVRLRIEQIRSAIDAALPTLLSEVPRSSQEKLSSPGVDEIERLFGELERLVGDSVQRLGRWTDLRRHLRFSEGHDWHDIAEQDWPSIRGDLDALTLADGDPLSVPNIDLGEEAARSPEGPATLELPWDRLSDDGFERLLADLLRSYSQNENVELLMKTHAADRGRDISFIRVLSDGTGGVRRERVILQAKHWRSKSVGPDDVSAALTGAQMWSPPVVHGLVVATSGRFTANAVDWAEKHNERGGLPIIELWPENRLETMLAEKPRIAAAHGLR